MKWLWHLTGGRPMLRQQGLFRDCISGESVVHYIDRLGRHWLAADGLSLFRVKRDANPIHKGA